MTAGMTGTASEPLARTGGEELASRGLLNVLSTTPTPARLSPMRAHRLAPLLQPASIALLGASTRPASVGQTILKQLTTADYQGRHGGRLYLVNPRYEEIQGQKVYASLAELPEVPEHVFFGVPNAAIEEALKEAIRLGVRAGTMVSSLFLPDDAEPGLPERVRRLCRESGFLLCGANGMGLYNFHAGVWLVGYDTRANHRPGGISFFSHSGSALCSMIDAEGRIDYNFVASTGQELSVSMADYMDYALEHPSTVAIGILLETIRDPAAFERALAKAAEKRVPIVAIKVGKSPVAAALAASHSGALVGDDGAYQALFDRYGVLRVDSLDELAATLLLFQQSPKALPPGGLVTLHDSGGERELLIDLAEARGVPFAQISEATAAKLSARLDPGLLPVNPLDAWGTGNDAYQIYADCMSAMMQDADAAIGAVVCDRLAEGAFFHEHAEVALKAMQASGKPVVCWSNHQGSGDARDTVDYMRKHNLPVFDGVPALLAGVRALFAFRDFRPSGAPPAADPAVVEKWRTRLAAGGTLEESEGLDLLADFGLPVVPRAVVADRDAALEAAAAFGFPVVLKTSMPGIAHKSDVGGVKLGLADADAVGAAYDDLAKRLGPRVLVAPMAGKGVEMILGVTRDPQLGPTVLVGSGGIHAEILKDVVTARPPFDAAWARRLLDRLKLRRLLDGVRGAPPADVAGLCEAAARLSVLAASLGDVVKEIDVNPLIVGPDGCLAVDALVVAG